jgi:hypothetical protein
MSTKQKVIKINKSLKFLVLFTLLFSINNLFSAEGGPCKDYGDCDKFKYSLNDMESYRVELLHFLTIAMDVIHFNIQDGEESQKIYKSLKTFFLKI